jgi:hypothetical protein
MVMCWVQIQVDNNVGAGTKSANIVPDTAGKNQHPGPVSLPVLAAPASLNTSPPNHIQAHAIEQDPAAEEQSKSCAQQ